MTIDPRLYQKISGRSGDVTDAYGKALAQTSKTDSERNSAPSANYGGVSSASKTRYILSIIGSLLLFGGLLWTFFIRK